MSTTASATGAITDERTARDIAKRQWLPGDKEFTLLSLLDAYDRGWADRAAFAFALVPPVPTVQPAGQPLILSDAAMANLRRFQETCIDDGSHDIGKSAIEELMEAGAVRTAGVGRHRVTAFGSWLLSQPSGSTTAPTMPKNNNDKAVYAIVFDDADVRHQIVIGEAAARAVFKRVSDQWNAHLFGKLESNSRDDRHARDNIDTAGAFRLPAGWFLSLRPDQSIWLVSPQGNTWNCEDSRGSGTDSAFMHEFLLALATDLGQAGG